ncbi:MAG TPA: D-arabinono-1,4-lactone oxidase [Candidatus Limnocylindrales bacterium]|nr:D-arabinono-1,4-lactone oxidase [Candidatus Limnocylindrales bacterium]
MKPAWRNWARSHDCTPMRRILPTREEEIVDALENLSGVPVRAAGSGHSFNALATTRGVQIDMRRFTGVLNISTATKEVTIRAGTSLGRLNEELHRAGLALSNVGTLAEQTVGGAIATGNHGTGLAFGPLSSFVTGLRMITAEGRAVDLRPGSDLFRCAKTSLGALGIVTSISLRCVPAFNVAVSGRSVSFDAMLHEFDAIVGAADQVSLSWRPWTETLTVREKQVTSWWPTRLAGYHRYASTLDECWGGLTGLAGAVRPGAVPVLSRWWGRVRRSSPRYVDANHRASTFPQPVKFLPLEHALPLHLVPEAMRALRSSFRRAGLFSPYALLIRVGAAEDAPLSPAYGRPTGYINLTVPRSARFRSLLRTVEDTLRDFSARPHWGKAHSATAEDLAPLYPEWSLFQRVRDEIDPAGRFGGDYLASVLGTAGSLR